MKVKYHHHGFFSFTRYIFARVCWYFKHAKAHNSWIVPNPDSKGMYCTLCQTDLFDRQFRIRHARNLSFKNSHL